MRVNRLLLAIYVVIGVIIASSHDYLENLETIKRIVSAVLAVLLWPLILLGISLRIK